MEVCPHHLDQDQRSFTQKVFSDYPARIKSIDQWSAFWMTHALEPREISEQYPPGAAQALIKAEFLKFIANKIRQGLVYGDPAALDRIAKTY